MAFAIALPGAATAQDPGVDQYTPSSPSADGPTPAPPPPDDGSFDGSGADTGGDGSGGAASDAPAPAPSVASPQPEAADGTQDTLTPTSRHDRSKEDRRTIDDLVTKAHAERDLAVDPGDSEAVAARLLRSDDGSGSGLGVGLWVIAAATLIWGIASRVLHHRRRDEPT